MRSVKIAISAAAILLTAASCGKEEFAKPKAAAPVPVSVSVAGGAVGAPGPLVSGVVRARSEAVLAFSVPGRVSRIMVNEGDRVGAGQVLAQIDMVEVDAGLAAARAEVARAEADLKRQRELFAKGWVAKARVDASEAATAAARAQVAARGFAQRYARITSPSGGVVMARSAEPGQIVAAGAPILTVSQASGGYVLRVALTDAQLASVRAGQIATVRLAALGGPPIAARIIELGGRGDPRTGTFEAELALPAMAGLRSGMLGEARLPAPVSAPTTLAIPASAVFQARADEAFVYVIDSQGKARTRRIVLGRIDNVSIEVLSGLTQGERVISKGLSRVREGVAVAVQADKAV